MTTSAPELPDFAPKLRLTQSHADVTRDVVATLQTPSRGYYMLLFGAVRRPVSLFN